MAKIRDHYWIPKQRQLVKRVRNYCWGCKRFRVQSYENPPPGNLPTTRTQGTTPLEVLGVELEDVVLDVEVALNDRPLSYLEDDIELPVLTPATMLNVNSSQLAPS